MEELLKWTPVRHGPAFSINGEMLSTFRLRRRRLRVCPDCVEADLAAAPDLRGDASVACRVFTILDGVRTCPIHLRSLVQVASASTFGWHYHDYAIAFGDALEDLPSLHHRSVARNLTQFEAYLLGRLGVSTPQQVSLLDELDLSQVTSLCERLGVFDLYGREAGIGSLDEDGMLACAQTGFEWCVRGEEGIRDFVTMAHERAVRDGVAGKANTIFGHMRSFLSSETRHGNFARVKQVLVDRLSELLPYGPEGPTVFGILPRRRHWHTLISAGRQYGLSGWSIRKRVRIAGIGTRLNEGFGRTPFLIPAEDLEQLLDSPDGLMTRAEVIQRTGAVAYDFVVFETAGILAPASGKAVESNSSYRRGDVRRLERQLLENSVQVAAEEKGLVDLHTAHKQSSWSRAEVLSHVISGKVGTRSVAGQRSIASIRVDLQELHRLHPLFGREVLSSEDAAPYLGVTERTVRRLVKRGWIPSYYERHAESGKLRYALCKDDVLAFKREYMPLSEVLDRLGGAIAGVNPALEAKGVYPVFPPQAVLCTFYSRPAVDAAFPP